MIAIINYGMGNLGSVSNMLKKIGFDSIITSNEKEILRADKIILPGVGSFDTAIKKIDSLGLRDIIKEAAMNSKIPTLGICLGMQLLMESSEEGELDGLGLIKGKTLSFKNRISANLKIPHMGWNSVKKSNECIISDGFENEMRFYFVHSYFVKVRDSQNSVLQCEYGLNFDAAINYRNIFGVQFHPEKSHKFGMQILKNFSNI